jgi:predicted helicase
MSTIHTILDQIRDTAKSEADKGARFEELIRQYLLNDPVYKGQYNNVWRWMDYPGRDGKTDTGIDLVAERIDGTGFVAIQCKCYDADTTIQKSHIDSFLTASGKKNQYVDRIIVSSTPHWSKHAEDAICGQHPPVHRIDLNELNNSAIDWSQFDVNKPKVTLKSKKTLREHQKTALDQVRDGYKTQDRGQLIMACGTGKTFTSLKIAEEHAGKGGLVLFLVPSLSLLSQTLREWLTESAVPLHCYAVCSDVKIGKHNESDPTSLDDLEIPATTDGKELSKSLATAKRNDKMTVIFSTYQSIDAINIAQKHGVPEFDIIICDEAHRTTGAKLEGDEESHFVRVHDNNTIKGKKRLYMTATPRLYSAEAKTRA